MYVPVVSTLDVVVLFPSPVTYMHTYVRTYGQNNYNLKYTYVASYIISG